MEKSMKRRSFFRSLAAALISVPLARMIGAEMASLPSPVAAIHSVWEDLLADTKESADAFARADFNASFGYKIWTG